MNPIPPDMDELDRVIEQAVLAAISGGAQVLKPMSRDEVRQLSLKLSGEIRKIAGGGRLEAPRISRQARRMRARRLAQAFDPHAQTVQQAATKAGLSRSQMYLILQQYAPEKLAQGGKGESASDFRGKSE